MVVEIKYSRSSNGKRFALYRIQGYRSLHWMGISVRIADQALRSGVIPTGRLRGALAIRSGE